MFKMTCVQGIQCHTDYKIKKSATVHLQRTGKRKYTKSTQGNGIQQKDKKE